MTDYTVDLSRKPLHCRKAMVCEDQDWDDTVTQVHIIISYMDAHQEGN